MISHIMARSYSLVRGSNLLVVNPNPLLSLGNYNIHLGCLCFYNVCVYDALGCFQIVSHLLDYVVLEMMSLHALYCSVCIDHVPSIFTYGCDVV